MHHGARTYYASNKAGWRRRPDFAVQGYRTQGKGQQPIANQTEVLLAADYNRYTKNRADLQV
jgi:hypothetical protein